MPSVVESLLEPIDVTLEDGAHVSVHDGRGESLVLTKLGRDLERRRDDDTGGRLGDDRLGATFVDRVRI